LAPWALAVWGGVGEKLSCIFPSRIAGGPDCLGAESLYGYIENWHGRCRGLAPGLWPFGAVGGVGGVLGEWGEFRHELPTKWQAARTLWVPNPYIATQKIDGGFGRLAPWGGGGGVFG
jgi:hypothetical protein